MSIGSAWWAAGVLFTERNRWGIPIVSGSEASRLIYYQPDGYKFGGYSGRRMVWRVRFNAGK